MNGNRRPRPVFPGGVVVDASDPFVPENQRLPEGECADGAMPVVVQVGPADPAMRDAHQHVVVSWGAAGDVVQAEVGGCVDGEGFHFLGFSLDRGMALTSADHRAYFAGDDGDHVILLMENWAAGVRGSENGEHPAVD